MDEVKKQGFRMLHKKDILMKVLLFVSQVLLVQFNVEIHFSS
jgi:hypothetical protein